MSTKTSRLASTRAFHQLLAVEPMQRIDLVRKGLPASFVQAAAEYLSMSQKDLLSAIRIPVSTLTLRARDRKPLSPEESDKLIRLAEAVNAQASCSATKRKARAGCANRSPPSVTVGPWICSTPKMASI
jgi:putative toxin-antitoxin system antitoxin component (TIGR02293 family)